MEELNIKSPAFNEGEEIPIKYTCDGENVNPELIISNIPKNTESILLLVNDPDAPIGDFTHWILMNISPSETIKIEENSSPGKEGINDFGSEGYKGPCPPSGTHRYHFNAYALDKTLERPDNTKRKEIDNVIRGHILAHGILMGKYSRG
ncbi:MAG: YbhB/YbcL family Raf kinase inhibitor-like protein [Nanobdellota archaeon]